MAMLMGICYVANPMHQQISSVFHEITHFLEAPQSLLSHHSHNTGHDHDDHEPGEHNVATADHQHTLLDLIDSIFDASDTQHPEDDTAISLTKWDKHLGSECIILPKTNPPTTSQYSISMEKKVRKGHSAHPEEPPQIVFS